MELYHLHLLGNHDYLYKPNKEFTIDPDKFNNRIYKRIYDMNSTVKSSDFKDIVDELNHLLSIYGMGGFGDRINPGELIEYILKRGCSQEELINLLKASKEIILSEGINLRETAMEEYRRINTPNIPSRLHSLFACSEEGINFWLSQIRDNDLDIYRLDVMEEPFVSNESLLPYEELSYGDKVKASYNYFHPKKKDLDDSTNEYLVQGKLRILEKVGEVRSK